MTDLADTQAKVKELLKPMLRLDLFAIHWHLAGSVEAMNAMLPEHLEHMAHLEKKGVLFASGPFIDGGQDPGAGLSIVRARDDAEAAGIARAEPLANAGIRDFTIRKWELREGALSIVIRFADGSYSLT
jgi:uncharacterized protein